MGYFVNFMSIYIRELEVNSQTFSMPITHSRMYSRSLDSRNSNIKKMIWQCIQGHSIRARIFVYVTDSSECLQTQIKNSLNVLYYLLKFIEKFSLIHSYTILDTRVPSYGNKRRLESLQNLKKRELTAHFTEGRFRFG